METPTHARLKQLAAAALLASGFRAVAVEVRCPASRYVVDAAGYLDPLPKRGVGGRNGSESGGAGGERLLCRGPRPRTAIIECKQSRGDFLRDTRETERLLSERERLDGERRRLEDERIKAHEPHLRRTGTFLFAELEGWDFSASRLATYRRVIAALRRLDRQLHAETKLWMVQQYRLADVLYLAAPAGMIARRELPPGWGLLEFSSAALRARDRGAGPAGPDGGRGVTVLPVRIAVPAPERVPRPEHQARLLRNIAAAATRDWARGAGVVGGAVGEGQITRAR